MTKEDYTISNIYQGGYSSLKPNYGDLFTGYRVAASELGAPTKPDTANQIQQVHQLLNQGIIPIEVGAIDPKIFDTIPKQHFKEINRMTKLTGAKISVHAPLVEPSGIGEQGWSEANRELAERQLNDIVEKSIEMDDKGGMPITIHSSGLPGTEFKMTPKGKKIEKLIIVDKETGKPVQALEEEKLYYPAMKKVKPEIEKKIQEGLISEEGLRDLEKKRPSEVYETISLEKGKIHSPEDRLRMINNMQWHNSISQIIFNKERADEILQQNQMQIQHLMKDLEEKRIKPEDLTTTQKQALTHLENARTYLEDTRINVEGLFNKAWKNGTEEERKILSNLSNTFQEDLPKEINPDQESRALQKLLINLKQVNPKLFVPIEDFAIDKSSQTFANVAFNAFDKFKDKTPIISIENLDYGMAFSSGEGMNKLITESKKKFVEKAIEKGYSDSEAKEQADKIIGMTLDVGHLNLAKKKGFEDKDLIKEVEQIAKHVKHIHLHDNFGSGDSHLPPGMGNVPIKEILEKLEKAGTLKDARKIVEAGGFVAQFGVSPYPISLEAMGSPIYSMQMGPYWNQAVGLQQGYFSGYGQMLPQINYETFGAGFSQLPSELGGQRQGADGGRISGQGME